VAAEFSARVTTTHVILADGQTRYEPTLSAWLASGARVPGVGRLRTAGSETVGDGTLLWERETFEAVMLRGSWWGRQRARAADPVLPSVWTAVRPETDRWGAWLRTAAARLHRAAWRQALRWRLAKPGPWMVG
jgi:hypothetical protein